MPIIINKYNYKDFIRDENIFKKISVTVPRWVIKNLFENGNVFVNEKDIDNYKGGLKNLGIEVTVLDGTLPYGRVFILNKQKEETRA